MLYAYNNWGALATVTNPLSYQHKVFYDLDGRLDSLAFPGGYELRRYDSDGRLVKRKEWLAGMAFGFSRNLPSVS